MHNRQVEVSAQSFPLTTVLKYRLISSCESPSNRIIRLFIEACGVLSNSSTRVVQSSWIFTDEGKMSVYPECPTDDQEETCPVNV